MKGKRGYNVDLEKETKKNTNFRKVLYTTEHSQLVLMSLKPKEEIGEEMHEDRDQFFRFESGIGTAVINGIKRSVKDGSAIMVPAGARHNIINTSIKKDLRFYTIYSPPEHMDKVVRKTRSEAMRRPEEFDGKTTE